MCRPLRICTLCKSESIENVDHFISHCNYFNNLRVEYFTKLGQINPYFTSMLSESKVKLILNVNTKNDQCINVICAFVAKIYKIRKSVP